MQPLRQASHLRQSMADSLTRLARLVQVVQGRGTMLRASLYRYRRRCGDSACRCSRGDLHGGVALSVSRHGRPHTVPLAGVDLEDVERHVEAYREWRAARALIVQALAQMLQAVDALARLRTIRVKDLRRGRGRTR